MENTDDKPKPPSWAARNARNLAFTAGLTAIAIGCFVERLSLGFIVPGTVICSLLVASQFMRRQSSEESRDA